MGGASNAVSTFIHVHVFVCVYMCIVCVGMCVCHVHVSAHLIYRFASAYGVHT